MLGPKECPNVVNKTPKSFQLSMQKPTEKEPLEHEIRILQITISIATPKENRQTLQITSMHETQIWYQI